MAAHDCELGEIQGDLVDVGDGPADIGGRKRAGMSDLGEKGTRMSASHSGQTVFLKPEA
jgi:hypothetical protein